MRTNGASVVLYRWDVWAPGSSQDWDNCKWFYFIIINVLLMPRVRSEKRSSVSKMFEYESVG